MLKRIFETIFAKDGKSLAKIQNNLKYQFKDKNLLTQALVHKSFDLKLNEELKGNYERLEFLGDSILNFLVTEHLYKKFPECKEGELSKKKAIIVSTRVLARCSLDLDLGHFLRISKSEEKAGGRVREGILADVFESILGAMFLDSKVENCRRFLKRFLFPKISEVLNDSSLLNYKSLFLEYSQANGYGTPVYKVLKEEGPEHQKLFHVEVIAGDTSWGHGTGYSKKKAEQKAAQMAMAKCKKTKPSSEK